MARRSGRTTPCTPTDRSGRLQKAKQFLMAAELIDAFSDDDEALADAYVTLCVHAGIAAADVICCARLGERSRSADHTAAADLLRRVDPALATTLGSLLGIKTKAGYDASAVSRADHKRSGRAAADLVAAAERVGA